MKNIEFINDDIKKLYKDILLKNSALSGVILYEFLSKDNKIKIEEIIKDLSGINIVVNDYNNNYIVTIDLLRNKIIFNNLNVPYTEIFDNYSRKHIVPNGYEYQNEKRTVFRKYLLKLNTTYANSNTLIVKEDNLEYSIHIISNKKGFDINEFIIKLLNYNDSIVDLKKLLQIISEIIDLSYFDIKLSCKNGDLIKITYGMLTDYVEYQDNDEESRKIYLKNGEFLIERRIKERLDYDDVTPFMKKIGVYNGKEKR